MSHQTDRQTDKATNWVVTAYNEDILLLEDVSNIPHFVHKVYGGREICPTTGREHFQGHIQCKSQQRFSAIKRWLRTAHIEVCRDFKASIAYAMKEDTASGVKNEVINPREYKSMEEALIDVAAVCDYICGHTAEDPDPPSGCPEHLRVVDILHYPELDYWHRVNQIIIHKPYLAGLYSRPDLMRSWKYSKGVWMKLAFARKNGV